MYRFIDVHCHPNLGVLKKEQDAVVAQMKDESVLGIVVGVDYESSAAAVTLAKDHEHLFATVGLHPNDTPHEAFDANAFAELLSEKKVVAVGECGLDYFRIEGDEAQEKERQWKVFKEQVQFAMTHNLPLMIHCRPQKGSMDAYEELATYFEKIKSTHGDTLRGNMHFFVGNLEVARRFWALGFTTSFTGVITFASEYDDVVREAPLDMILTETDAPYAAPLPHRGKTNKPVYVRHVAERIAALRGISEEEVSEVTLRNAARMFGVSGA